MSDTDLTQNTSALLDEIQELVVSLAERREQIKNEMESEIGMSDSQEEEIDEDDEEETLKEQEKLRKQLDDDLNNLLLNFIENKE